MAVIAKLISVILVLCFIALLVWGVWTFVNDPSKIKSLLQKVTDLISKDEHKAQNREEYESSQEDIIRSIVKEEVERMGNKIIRSFPQPANINRSEIVNEIKHNRQLLECIMASLNKRPEKMISEPSRTKAQQYPIIKFARMVDSHSPLGFQMMSLSDTSKGACFQIVINSETQANYRLITDLAIQREIIAMFNPIITSGCKYEEEPTVINEIIHMEDGILSLHSGVWHIVKRTKIRFI